MEVIPKYKIPESWDDKGMDWENPDPRRADYVMALREAVMERVAATQNYMPDGVMSISPYKAVSMRTISYLLDAIDWMAPDFVNLEAECEDILTDFPKMWSYEDLIKDEKIRLYAYPNYGQICGGAGEWLKAIKNALDKLTVIRAKNVYGVHMMRDGSKHDPPFAESIGTAMDQAFGSLYEGVLDGRFPSSIYGWSGNTHWKCPKPDADRDDEYNVDGYCGYAQSQAYEIKAVKSYLACREFDVKVAVYAEASNEPVPFSQVLDGSTFDSLSAGFSEGLNWLKPIHVKDWKDTLIKIGDPDAIPRNSKVPSSEFDGEGTAITRHSYRIGWKGTVFGFIDYATKNGFRFYKKEE